MIDLTCEASPFANLDILMDGLGKSLISRTKTLAEKPEKFRLCVIIGQAGGERIKLELKYDG